MALCLLSLSALSQDAAGVGEKEQRFARERGEEFAEVDDQALPVFAAGGGLSLPEGARQDAVLIAALWQRVAQDFGSGGIADPRGTVECIRLAHRATERLAQASAAAHVAYERALRLRLAGELIIRGFQQGWPATITERLGLLREPEPPSPGSTVPAFTVSMDALSARVQDLALWYAEAAGITFPASSRAASAKALPRTPIYQAPTEALRTP